MKQKVAVIGAGNVGASAALYAAERGLGDVTLIDIVEGMPQGKALDMAQTAPLWRKGGRIEGANDLGAVAGADVVIMTAGFPRKPGMSRTDLLKANADIVRPAAEAVRKHAPQAYVVVVTNPLDVMAYMFWKVSGFPAARIAEIAQRTRDGGAEIVKLLKTGSAYYAPAMSAVEMAEAILTDQKRLAPCSVLLDGQYGMRDLFIGVPVVVGARGVEKIIELKLAAEELAALQKSGKDVASSIAELQVGV